MSRKKHSEKAANESFEAPEDIEQTVDEVAKEIAKENIEEELIDAEESVENAAEEIKHSLSKAAAKDKKTLKHGALSVAITAGFVAAVVVLNIITALLSDRFDLAADLTDTGVYTLDEKTEEYIEKNLSSDVKITVLSAEKTFEDGGSYFKQAAEILRKMAKKSDNISLSFIDISQNPAFAAKFAEENLTAQSIVVESPKTGRHKVLTQSDYFGLEDETAAMYYYYYGYVSGSSIEQAAVSAMMSVTNERPVRIAFTEGFGERGGDALKNLLSKNGYECETLDLLKTDVIDENIDFIVIYAPRTDFDKALLQKLENYLENGGKLGKNIFYFAATSQPKTPNIDAFLADWGISVGYEVIGQSKSEYLLNNQTLYAHLQSIVESGYTKDIYDSRLYTIGADLRPVYMLERSRCNLEPLMTTFDGAFLYPLDAGSDFTFDNVTTGTYNDAVMSYRSTSDGKLSRVCAVGSDQLSGSYFLNYQNASNADFFLSLFNNVSGKEKSVSIVPKSFSEISFDMTAETANGLLVFLCVVLPLIVIVLGIVIWVRRRRR